MSPPLLYYAYGLVMLASLVCFVQAWRTRFVTPVHKRWGATGVLMALAGILVVLAATYLFGWRVEQRFPALVQVHRTLALGATALMAFVGYSGWRRMPIHRRLYVVFLPLYVATVATALIGYRP